MQPYASYVPPPPPQRNGGLYSGPNSTKPWAAIPVIPDVDYMTHVNLRSANPPPGAIYQYQGNIRPGNNFQSFPGLTPYTPTKAPACGGYNFLCSPCQKTTPCGNNLTFWCMGDNTWSDNPCANKKIIQID